MNNLFKMFLKSQKLAKVRMMLVIIIFGAITFFVFKTAPAPKDILQVDTSGGTITIHEGKLKGFSIDIPEAAYTSTVTFDITSKPFDNNEVPDLFEAITPLIHIDNQNTPAQQPLTVTIPIDLDTDHEYAMAFYYDETDGSFEAIPTIALTDDHIKIMTSHFSSIVVSKVKMSDLFELVFMSPEKFDSGFEAGIDDFPFDNYGSEIAPEGHCAGQSLGMIWYYTERKLKYSDENLFTRFNQKTPDFWIDDSDAYRFASVLQDTFDFDSDKFDHFFEMLDALDQARFLSVAYALYMTREPQLFAIYKTDEVTNEVYGHALVVNKLTYDLNQYKIHIVDPNFHGDTSRFINYHEQTGFGTYYSGSNAEDIANEKGINYDRIAHIGQSAFTDYKFIDEQYKKVLDGTIGDTYFSEVRFEYLRKTVEDTWVWTPLSNTLDYEGHAKDNVLSNTEIAIRVIAKWQNYQVTLFKNQETIASEFTNNWDKVTFIVDLGVGKNAIGILYSKLDRKIITEDFKQKYNAYHHFDITLVQTEPIVYDIDEIRAGLPGQYIEVERSSGVDINYPHLEITISEKVDTYMRFVYFDHALKTTNKKGDWFASLTVPGYESGTPILILDDYRQSDHYLIDPSAQTIKRLLSNGEYILYEKQPSVTYVYYYYHRVQMIQVSGNVYDYVYALIEGPIVYDKQWKIDMMNPDGNSGQDEVIFYTNNPIFDVYFRDSRSLYPFYRIASGGSGTYISMTSGDQYTLTIEIRNYVDGAWVITETQTFEFSADFTQ